MFCARLVASSAIPNLKTRSKIVSRLTLPGLPGELHWINTASSWKQENGGLQILAPAKTDLFVDPAGGMVKDDSPRAMFTADPQFTLSAHVTVDFAATYDAGVLV